MDFQNERRPAGNRASVIPKRGLVRGADFTQLRSAEFEYLRYAKSAADLDELAAGNDHFVLQRLVLRRAPRNISWANCRGWFAEVSEHEDQRGRVVIYNSRCLCAREQRQASLQVGS